MPMGSEFRTASRFFFCHQCRESFEFVGEVHECSRCHGGFIEEDGEALDTYRRPLADRSYRSRRRWSRAVEFFQRLLTEIHGNQQRPAPPQVLAAIRQVTYSSMASSDGVDRTMDSASAVPAAVAGRLAVDRTTSDDGKPITTISQQPEPRCAICCTDFAGDDTVSCLPGCGHFFHDACIRPWLARADTCPICRRNLGEAVGVASSPTVMPIGGDNGGGSSSNTSGSDASLRGVSTIAEMLANTLVAGLLGSETGSMQNVAVRIGGPGETRSILANARMRGDPGDIRTILANARMVSGTRDAPFLGHPPVALRLPAPSWLTIPPSPPPGPPPQALRPTVGAWSSAIFTGIPPPPSQPPPRLPMAPPAEAPCDFPNAARLSTNHKLAVAASDRSSSSSARPPMLNPEPNEDGVNAIAKVSGDGAGCSTTGRASRPERSPSSMAPDSSLEHSRGLTRISSSDNSNSVDETVATAEIEAEGRQAKRRRID